ncbi:endonuclease [Brevibacillus laterosporus]|uniref:HNH endonuclease n=1 Tax=Brevibacillus laterosporus TaxID=1465 RepID=UPI000CE41285|nr:HNH endonuclease [Brevibacillus laterosporus]PPA82511.1 endonuclease [Brevibacillus laterosporus]
MNYQKDYDKYKRNKIAKVFYSSNAWLKVKRLALQRDHYLCQQCLDKRKITPADVVHHRVALLDNWNKALALDNLECVCHSCHNKAHPEKGGKGRRMKIPSRSIRIVVSEVNEELI